MARLRRADALDVSRLQHAKQLGLQRQWDVADLVEEDRTRIGQLESAHAIRFRVCKGAFDVPEELTLEDALGEPAHVHGDERLLGPRR